MGAPEKPSEEQYAVLERSGQLEQIEMEPVRIEQGKGSVRLRLPRQAVALIVLEW
jgi:hypothetical protein